MHSHSHGSGQSPDHDHQHSHAAPQDFNRAFFIATVANGLFVLLQIVYAILANSTSLLADAIHNFGDVLSLILAWVANSLMTRKPTLQSSYGLKKSSILASLANGILLVFSCGIIATEALYQFLHPEPVHAQIVMVVASIGILINASTAALFLRGRADLNIRGAWLHLFYDAILSAGVVVAAGIMWLTGWLWVDALMGMLIAIIILRGTWSLFTDSLRLMLDAVPRNISMLEVRQRLLEEPGVEQVHDLHIWALSTRENALSVHLYMPKQALADADRQRLIQELKSRFDIHHSTIQVESDLEYCEDAC